MRLPLISIHLILCLSIFNPSEPALAQEYCPPDRGQPGDKMIQDYLTGLSKKLHEKFMEGIKTVDQWLATRSRYKKEYFYMLGLWPLPHKTPLKATITGSLKGKGFVVDMVYFQSRPHLYVTANLYKPERIDKSARLPAILYVCGHSYCGRNGNKIAYQSNGIWFARHGYICIVLDTLQLGEIAGIHHGTYREKRWWWHSRGYTPAGVECWNGIRAIDYLVNRPDVDPKRIAVTGISGGGAATYWISAADERVRVAVPVSGMADLPSYVGNRVINGHCDCMFLYNTFQWPWTRIAALIAPRPLLIVNSDNDHIFPMDANERIINRLKRIYSLFGKSYNVNCLVSIGGHAYREDIRRGAFRFINTYLKADSRPVTDSEIDLVTRERGKRICPIPPEKLRVFPTDADIPGDEINTTCDRMFVPIAKAKPCRAGNFDAWKKGLVSELRRVTFRCFPKRIPQAKLVEDLPGGTSMLESEPGIRFFIQMIRSNPRVPKRIILAVAAKKDGASDAASKKDKAASKNSAAPPSWYSRFRTKGDAIYLCRPRGTGETRWTRKNPPNYVERSLVLLGRTADTGRVWDIIAAARYMEKQFPKTPVWVMGKGAGGILAAYAALFEDSITGIGIVDPPKTHMDPKAPQFLNVLRVCDIPQVLDMLAPRPCRIASQDFPSELVNFVPYNGKSLFAGTGMDTWDRNIRERGYILKEGNTYYMWYTGYNEKRSDKKYLGLATSKDGIKWIRYRGIPIFKKTWVEDMQVIKHGSTYYMFAEGRHDIAHMLSSTDRIHWKEHGSLDIRLTTGKPLPSGPYGTPTVFISGKKWYLFYERNDGGIWLALSTDQKVWTNVQDDPVIAMGPEPYDKHGIAVNQVIKYKEKYYAYYHGSGYKPWKDWTTNVAVSNDLVHWKKYPGNPIITGNKSSGILVFDGKQYRLYTMHPDVRLYFPVSQ